MLEELFESCRGLTDGSLADYIPELAKADPDWFGVVLATTDGQVYALGDAQQPFTIQSVSKPFTYGLALDAHGPDVVLERVGVEPTGNTFNAIIVDDGAHRPFNPMVNAGAIVVSDLIPGAEPGARMRHIVDGLGAFAGRSLEIDEAVFESERATGDRNRAIAYLMRSLGMLDDVEATLDRYFRQCSVLVTCHDLAVMAATLANGGINPLTGATAASEKSVERVLSVMSTCGMYDYAGQWAYAVGLPAKSGVSGGVIAVLPGQLGIGVFSPLLDDHGNSQRGIAVCERLSSSFALHEHRAWPRTPTALRRRYSADEVRSSRVRTVAELSILDERGASVAIYELQGDLHFTSLEPVLRAIATEPDGVHVVVLDLRRVRGIDEPAIEMFRRLADDLHARGCRVLVTDLDPSDAMHNALSALTIESFEDVERAIAACEDQLLASASHVLPGQMGLRDQELLRGLSGDEIAALEALVEIRELAVDDTVVREGEAASEVFFLLTGTVSARLVVDGRGRTSRLATFGPGVAFGEATLLGESVRTADVCVETPATVAVLTVVALQSLATGHPALVDQIRTNLTHVLARRLQAANRQIRALQR